MCRKLIIILIFFNTYFCEAQNWQSLGKGLDYYATRCLYNDTVNDLLYVSGHFKYADSIEANGIATWNGSQWDSVGSGFSICASDCFTYWDILRHNGYIYTAGYPNTLITSGSYLVNFVSRWDGVDWENIDGEHYYDCHAGSLYEYNETLLVGGCFDSIGGIEAHQIAVWNDSTWSKMDTTDFDGNIGTFIEYKNELYIGGNFDTQSGLHEIARWNGITWYPVGNGIYGDSWVNCFAIYHNELYVGGYFDKGSGNAGNFIQKWDGDSWHDVGGGMSMGQVFDLAVYDDALWAVGQFSYAGSVPAQYIAKWDGSKWCGLGSSFSNTILNICVFNNELYIGGGFKTIDGDTMNYIAKWIGGDYVDTCSTVGISDNLLENELFQLSPNPANTELNVKLNEDIPGEYTITLYDMQGKTIRIITSKEPETEIDISQLPKGVYGVKVVGNGIYFVDKVVKIE